jgi:hypothetical protein
MGQAQPKRQTALIVEDDAELRFVGGVPSPGRGRADYNEMRTHLGLSKDAPLPALSSDLEL